MEQNSTLTDRAWFMTLLKEAGRFGLGREALMITGATAEGVINWRRAGETLNALLAPHRARDLPVACEADSGITVEFVDLDESEIRGCGRTPSSART